MIDLYGEAGREIRRHILEAVAWITNINMDFQANQFRSPQALATILGLAEDELRVARQLLESQG